MPFLAGEIVTAEKLNRLQPRLYEITADTNLDLSTSTTETDMPGMEIVLDSLTANAQYKVTAVFAWDIVNANTDYMEGRMQLNGVQIVGNARWSGEVATDFGMGTQVWEGNLGAAGTYTFKGRVAKTGGTNATIRTLAAFTRMTVEIFEVV